MVKKKFLLLIFIFIFSGVFASAQFLFHPKYETGNSGFVNLTQDECSYYCRNFGLPVQIVCPQQFCVTGRDSQGCPIPLSSDEVCQAKTSNYAIALVKETRSQSSSTTTTTTVPPEEKFCNKFLKETVCMSKWNKDQCVWIREKCKWVGDLA